MILNCAEILFLQEFYSYRVVFKCEILVDILFLSELA
jgi:hypothetical protein